LFDHLGSPRVIARPSDNAIVWRWDNIDPFGNNAANENPSGLGTFKYALRLPGQYFDAETGTHYNYFRDYDPIIGRYIQSDPVGLLAGLTTFGYVSAKPLTLRDPFGLVKWTGPGFSGGVGRVRDSAWTCTRSPRSVGVASESRLGLWLYTVLLVKGRFQSPARPATPVSSMAKAARMQSRRSAFTQSRVSLGLKGTAPPLD